MVIFNNIHNVALLKFSFSHTAEPQVTLPQLTFLMCAGQIYNHVSEVPPGFFLYDKLAISAYF